VHQTVPHQSEVHRGRSRFWLATVLGCTLLGTSTAGTHEPDRLQDIIDELRTRLGISAAVEGVVVSENALLVSVEAQKNRVNTFQLSFEDRFLRELTDHEIRAVIAHELGHVWIFTHHPYLQTERLANEVAMRVVSRESLQSVYEKVSQRGAGKGEFAHFLGQ
jgi:hypothetical protein